MISLPPKLLVLELQAHRLSLLDRKRHELLLEEPAREAEAILLEVLQRAGEVAVGQSQLVPHLGYASEAISGVFIFPGVNP